MNCPNCQSDHVHLVKEVDTTTKGYGAGEGFCGYILFGPIGLLCGLCGAGNSRLQTARHYYECDSLSFTV
ncbi:hypothetical protein AZF37_00735 [endosymbiont 'TC1' of Trimyema compressum]|nr:hypothetical protein AZF37_00735 [endosymbiont 'TC1' of Trimyema compressum]